MFIFEKFCLGMQAEEFLIYIFLFPFVSGKVPCIQNSKQKVVAVSKHLCGAATGTIYRNVTLILLRTVHFVNLSLYEKGVFYRNRSF